MSDLTNKNNISSNGVANDVFAWPVRVYYEDTDTGGVVFYANYLKFFERARTEWLRARGYSQQALAESAGLIFVVKSTAVDYFSPARLDDELKLTVVVEQFRNASLAFVQEAWRIKATPRGTAQETEQTLLARGRITIVCVNAASFRPQAIPEEMLARFKENL
ncbi:tol-pal system-associated acyl-CoA thioesterase [Herbaspirillum sp. CF444]|uniref:tol-pal system-associated acyl-CoA thioesterase n=1 Tax=Herbaspirillum sp. CF444 TaxID=1144319 RepID=UPI0002723355|nr:tol-pal system-associated acyl-CoA thioesterase [Herbaspirillum sp. CF444]EJL93350.1 tol-pal system-associated acyl-CoA thioesterase [Herbaspirillum sp. CF444]